MRGLGVHINGWCNLHLEGDGNKVKCNVVIMAVYGDLPVRPIWSNEILIETLSFYSTSVPSRAVKRKLVLIS